MAESPALTPAELQISELAEMRSAPIRSSHFFGLNLLVEAGVYYPTTDTRLLGSVLEIEPGGRALDIGTGSGALALRLADIGAQEVVATEVNQAALRNAANNAALNSLTVDIREADLFEGLEGQFDLIVFNPPYSDRSPSDEVSRCFYDLGHASLKRFFKQLPDYLQPNGRALLSWSDIGPINMPYELAEDQELSIQLLDHETSRRGYQFFAFAIST